MKKIILTILAVLMLVPVVLGANGIDATPINTILSGSSGTVTGSFNLENTVTNDLLASFSGYTLTSLTNTISITSISSQTVLAGQNKTVSFSVPIGTKSPGTYSGTLDITNATNGVLFDTVSVQVVVGTNQNFTLNSQTSTVTTDPGKTGTTNTVIINNGNVALSGLSITHNSAEFYDMVNSKQIVIGFSQTTGINIAKDGSKTIIVSANVPIGTAPGTYSGTVTVMGPIQRTFTLNVIVRSVLRITDVDISSVGGDDDVKRGEEVEIDVDYENFASDIDISDVEVKYTIIDGTHVLEDDDGDDIEDEESVRDLDDGDDGTISFTFNIPFDIQDGDDYTVLIELIGENEDDSSQTFYHNMTSDIHVELESHEVEITKAQFDTPIMSCGDTSVRLNVEVMNIGDNNEDVELIVRNGALNIEEISFFELDDDFDDEDEYTESKSYIFTPTDADAGNYNFYIEAHYDDGDEKDTEVVVLSIASCDTTTTTTTPTQEDVVVTYVPRTSTTSGVPTSAPISLTDRSGSDVDWGVVGLVTVLAVLGGGAIGLGIKYFGQPGIKEYK